MWHFKAQCSEQQTGLGQKESTINIFQHLHFIPLQLINARLFTVCSFKTGQRELAINVFTNVYILLHRQWSLIHRYNTGNFMVEKDSGLLFFLSKSGDAQIKNAEFLTVGKAFKAIFWPAPIFGDFTVWVRYITLQGKSGGGREYHKHTGIYRYINESSSIYTHQYKCQNWLTQTNMVNIRSVYTHQ